MRYTRRVFKLSEAIGIQPNDCVAVVGAGGKTSLCWLLIQELVTHGSPVVFTTTTRIRQPAPGTFDRLILASQVTSVSSALSDPSVSWHTACVAAAVEGVIDDVPLVDSLMPVVHTKLMGLSDEQVCALWYSIAKQDLPMALVVEADGARGLLIKAPAEHEPVIPACTTLVCVVANLDGIGQPLDERVAHRPGRIARLTGRSLGEPITPALLLALLTHPDGGLKGIPIQARRIAVLMQNEVTAELPDADWLVGELVAGGYDVACVITPRVARVVPLVLSRLAGSRSS